MADPEDEKKSEVDETPSAPDSRTDTVAQAPADKPWENAVYLPAREPENGDHTPDDKPWDRDQYTADDKPWEPEHSADDKPWERDQYSAEDKPWDNEASADEVGEKLVDDKTEEPTTERPIT